MKSDIREIIENLPGKLKFEIWQELRAISMLTFVNLWSHQAEFLLECEIFQTKIVDKEKYLY
jgi:hypothetical protein